MTAECESTEKRRVVTNAELPMVDCQMQSPNNTTVYRVPLLQKHIAVNHSCMPNVATLANGVS